MFNGAKTGFMLLAAALVMLMTPGLAFFYGGLVGRSNTLTIMIQSFASMGVTTILWWAVGYSLCFSGGANGIYGNFDYAFLRHVGVDTMYQPSGIPLTVLIAYQMMFAIITPALITGAFTNRVTFKSPHSSSRVERLAGHGGGVAFLTGIVLNIFPGPLPLIAMKDMAELDTQQQRRSP